MKTYRLTPEAEADLDEITDYYRDKSPAYGRRLVGRIEQRCRHLASFPRTGKPRDQLGQGVRTSAVTPYII